MHILHFNLSAVPPFRLDLTVWALKRRGRNIVDYWDGSCYTRVFKIENSPVKVEVRQKTKKPQISLVVSAHHPIKNLKSTITNLLNTMLGLKIDLAWFYERVKDDPFLFPLVLKFKGVKPPRLPTIFETLANAIAFQQISLESGFSLLNNLTRKYGTPFDKSHSRREEKNQIYYGFPEPEEIMKCKTEDLMALGFSRRKSETLISIASTLVRETIFCHLDQLSNESAIKLLCSFKGIGQWSAEYTLLRGLGKIEILPGKDVSLLKNLSKLLKLRKKPTFDKIKKIEKKWHPYAGLIYFHFLLEKLSKTNSPF
jgi:DNA-3-methyladenine glycosylase II